MCKWGGGPGREWPETREAGRRMVDWEGPELPEGWGLGGGQGGPVEVGGGDDDECETLGSVHSGLLECLGPVKHSAEMKVCEVTFQFFVFLTIIEYSCSLTSKIIFFVLVQYTWHGNETCQNM